MTAMKLTLTMPELAESLGVDRATVYRLLKSGTLDLPVFHIGSSTRVRLADVEAYLERLAEEARLEQNAAIMQRTRRLRSM